MKKDQMSSLVWLGFAVSICTETLRSLPIDTWHNPGAGFWPLGAGLFIGVLAVVNFLRASFLDRSAADRSHWYPKKWPRIVGVIAALMVYTALLDWLGFLLGTFFLLLFLFRTPEPQRWTIALAGSALVALTTYGVFERWLKVQLPIGFLGF